MGLLSIASHLDDKPKQGLAFSDFILKYKYNCCAILQKTENIFSVINSIGFDGKSIISSISTPDFWQGICTKKNIIYNFSTKNNTITPLLQLFSLQMKESISEISVMQNNDERIILVCNSALTEEAVKDFPASSGLCKHKCNPEVLNKYIKEASVLLKFQINLNEAVESFVLSNYKGSSSIKNILETAIVSEFYNKFLTIFNQKDASANPEPGIINSVFITDKTYSTELIVNHLILNFRDTIEDSAELAEIQYLGKIENYKDITEFLQAE